MLTLALWPCCGMISSQHSPDEDVDILARKQGSGLFAFVFIWCPSICLLRLARKYHIGTMLQQECNTV